MAAFVITTMTIGIFGLMVATAIMRGYVLSILWGWFVVPIFGVPQIGIAQAIGVAMVVSLMTHQYVPQKEKDRWMPVITALLTPVFALAIGWIVKQWL